MDISDIVSTDYVEFSGGTPASKLAGAFDDSSVKGVVVTEDGDYEGIVTRRQLARTHHPPDTKVRSLVWHVPTVSPREDVRAVAQFMLDSDARVLPVFEGDSMGGVVTADDLLANVEPHLAAVTVDDVCTDDLYTVEPDTTVAEALNDFRERRITHLPVVDGDEAAGLVSLSDVVHLTTRAVDKSQDGRVPGFDGHGGQGSSASYRTHEGWGAREGEQARILDLPARDVMSTPVWTARREESVDDALAEMIDVGGSSLVVVDAADVPVGIVTKTDVLEALTWGADETRPVQLYGVELLRDVAYDEVVALVEDLDGMDAKTTVHDVRIHLQEHDENLRGTPLVLARMRIDSDRGLFTSSGEGYGARHAIDEAKEAMEKRIRKEKTYGQSKKHPDETFWEKRFGWQIE